MLYFFGIPVFRYNGIPTIQTKKPAKLQLFFELSKYFCTFFVKKTILSLLFAYIKIFLYLCTRKGLYRPSLTDPVPAPRC